QTAALHDALPIWPARRGRAVEEGRIAAVGLLQFQGDETFVDAPLLAHRRVEGVGIEGAARQSEPKNALRIRRAQKRHPAQRACAVARTFVSAQDRDLLDDRGGEALEIQATAGAWAEPYPVQKDQRLVGRGAPERDRAAAGKAADGHARRVQEEVGESESLSQEFTAEDARPETGGLLFQRGQALLDTLARVDHLHGVETLRLVFGECRDRKANEARANRLRGPSAKTHSLLASPVLRGVAWRADVPP